MANRKDRRRKEQQNEQPKAQSAPQTFTPPVVKADAAPTAPAHSKADESSKIKRLLGWMFKNEERVALVLSIPAFAVAVLAALFTYRQAQSASEANKIAIEAKAIALQANKISLDTFDLTTGKTTAKFEFASFIPTIKEHPPELVIDSPYERRKSMLYKDLSTLRKLCPTVLINNTGTNSIDAVKIKTVLSKDFIVNGPTPEINEQYWKEDPASNVPRRVFMEEHILPRQWKPGEALCVPMLKGMLEQMMQMEVKTNRDIPHYAWVYISVTARLTGSTAFSGDYWTSNLIMAWIPNGFQEEETSKFLGKYQNVLEFGPAVPVDIPNIDTLKLRKTKGN